MSPQENSSKLFLKLSFGDVFMFFLGRTFMLVKTHNAGIIFHMKTDINQLVSELSLITLSG